MHLVPRELDKLIISRTGLLAQRRLARGVKLNHTEATALIAHILQELIRDGNYTVALLMWMGKRILGRRHVLPSVTSTLTQIQVEGTFLTGTHLVTVDQTISSEDGDIEKALYGSFLPHPSNDLFPLPAESEYEATNIPETMITMKDKRVVLNEGKRRIKPKMTSKGDRPVQVGSHYHFIETNPQLDFDRIRSYGYHLDMAAGTSVRFEPGETKTVTLVEIGGPKIIDGGSSIAPGPVDLSRTDEILRRLKQEGFAHTPAAKEDDNNEHIDTFTMDRDSYATMFGPTTGDLMRLGATDLWIKVEKDYTVHGGECTFGGGKTLRDGIGQASGRLDTQCLDLVITNALVVDWTGNIKADIGVNDGSIVGIGKAGNPDVIDGVSPGMVIGSNTDVITGEGKIITAGGIDTHVHLISPQRADEAISSGIMTVEEELVQDWGCTPAAIDSCLRVCDEFDIQCELHSDTLNESGFVERTAAAFKNRVIHAYHIEGAGGGHAPDIISLVEHPNVLPSSTNPTRQYTDNTIDENLDMVMACHHLSKNIPEDIAFAESRIRAETIKAEDVLHDIGAIIRTWNTAHENKVQRGRLKEDEGTDADNYRVKRYISKYTINPAITQGMSHAVGSVEVGKLADLVIWEPQNFGIKPVSVLKGGFVAAAQMGDPNASISTVQPVIFRPMFAPLVPQASMTFVSKVCVESGAIESYHLKKQVEVVKNCRNISKEDMKFNKALPQMKVTPNYLWTVVADGIETKADSATSLPLTQQYFIY